MAWTLVLRRLRQELQRISQRQMANQSLAGELIKSGWRVAVESLQSRWRVAGGSLESRWRVAEESLESRWRVAGESLKSRWRVAGESLEGRWLSKRLYNASSTTRRAVWGRRGQLTPKWLHLSRLGTKRWENRGKYEPQSEIIKKTQKKQQKTTVEGELTQLYRVQRRKSTKNKKT